MAKRDAGTPASPEQIARTVAWLQDIDGGQGNLARHTRVTTRALRRWADGQAPSTVTPELRRVHTYATTGVRGYRLLAASLPLLIDPLLTDPPLPDPTPGPIPPPPPDPRPRWSRRRVLVPLAAVAAAVLVGVWFWNRGPSISVVTPSAGDVAGHGSPLSGQLDGDLPGGWAVWGATYSPDSRYYPPDHPCDVARDGGITCDPLYVGRDEASGGAWQVCLLVVSDSGVLTDYANRANPRAEHPGLADPPSDTEGQDCVPVTN